MARKKKRSLGALRKGAKCVEYKIGPSGKKRCARFAGTGIAEEGFGILPKGSKCIEYKTVPAKRCAKFLTPKETAKYIVPPGIEVRKPRVKRAVAKVERKRRARAVAGLEGRRVRKGTGTCETITAHGRTLQVCKVKNPKTGRDFFFVRGY
jgi:hypothetical protein